MKMQLSEVVLRPIELDDIEALHSFWNDWTVVEQLGGFRLHASYKDVEEWTELHRRRADELIWAIADRKQNSCLGHVGLYQIDHRTQRAEFAICIGEKTSWGKGIGSEVCTAVLDFGFQQLNLHQVRLSVLESNSRAIHLYTNIGFRRDGCLRDEQFRDGRFVNLLVMSILRHEWAEKVRT